MSRRASGVLLHPTSLPGPYGIGDLGPAALTFLDWLQEAGQTVWQILPLGPVGHGNSPYDAQSSFAGNPLLIDPEGLMRHGLVDQEDLAAAHVEDDGRIEFAKVAAAKAQLLEKAFHRFEHHGASSELRQAFAAWRDSTVQASWLDAWSLYASLKGRFQGQSWTHWPPPLRHRVAAALDQARQDLADRIRYHQFVQFVFFSQWRALRAETQRRGISVLGDLPFYVALDSCEVWTRPELFDMDASGAPRSVAGVPPDYFSETGQRWGNPVYRWDRMAAQGFDWWKERLRFQLRLVDHLRLDHFRGFAAFWQIPAEHETAVEGQWCETPGRELLAEVRRALGGLPFVAEDLGVITPDVDSLRVDFGLPGMKVLQFAFDSPDSPHLPHNLTPDTVVYTGTHDNTTARGWIDSLDSETRQRLMDYLGGSPDEALWSLIRVATTSVADLVIFPVQDIAGLDSHHRMNTPGTSEGNWAWRLPEGTLTTDLAARLHRLTEIAGRAPTPDA